MATLTPTYSTTLKQPLLSPEDLDDQDELTKLFSGGTAPSTVDTTQQPATLSAPTTQTLQQQPTVTDAPTTQTVTRTGEEKVEGPAPAPTQTVAPPAPPPIPLPPPPPPPPAGGFGGLASLPTETRATSPKVQLQTAPQGMDFGNQYNAVGDDLSAMLASQADPEPQVSPSGNTDQQYTTTGLAGQPQLNVSESGTDDLGSYLDSLLRGSSRYDDPLIQRQFEVLDRRRDEAVAANERALRENQASRGLQIDNDNSVYMNALSSLLRGADADRMAAENEILRDAAATRAGDITAYGSLGLGKYQIDRGTGTVDKQMAFDKERFYAELGETGRQFDTAQTARAAEFAQQMGLSGRELDMRLRQIESDDRFKGMQLSLEEKLGLAAQEIEREKVELGREAQAFDRERFDREITETGRQFDATQTQQAAQFAQTHNLSGRELDIRLKQIEQEAALSNRQLSLQEKLGLAGQQIDRERIASQEKLAGQELALGRDELGLRKLVADRDYTLQSAAQALDQQIQTGALQLDRERLNAQNSQFAQQLGLSQQELSAQLEQIRGNLRLGNDSLSQDKALALLNDKLSRDLSAAELRSREGMQGKELAAQESQYVRTLRQSRDEFLEQARQFNVGTAAERERFVAGLGISQEQLGLEAERIRQAERMQGRELTQEQAQFAATNSLAQRAQAENTRQFNTQIATQKEQFKSTQGLEREQFLASLKIDQQQVNLRATEIQNQAAQFGKTLSFEQAKQAAEQQLAERGLDEESRQFNATLDLQKRSQSLEEELGRGSLQLNRQELQQQANQFAQSLGLSQQELSANLEQIRGNLKLGTDELSQDKALFLLNQQLQERMQGKEFEQQRAIQNQQLSEQRRQFDVGTAQDRDLALRNLGIDQQQVDLEARRLQEQSRQFGIEMTQEDAQFKAQQSLAEKGFGLEEKRLSFDQTRFAKELAETGRQFDASQAQQASQFAQEFGLSGRELDARISQIENDERFRGQQLGLEEKLGLAGQDIQRQQLAMEGEQFASQLAEEQRQFNTSTGEQRSQFLARLGIDQQAIEQEATRITNQASQFQQSITADEARRQAEQSLAERHFGEQQRQFDTQAADADLDRMLRDKQITIDEYYRSRTDTLTFKQQQLDEAFRQKGFESDEYYRSREDTFERQQFEEQKRQFNEGLAAQKDQFTQSSQQEREQFLASIGIQKTQLDQRAQEMMAEAERFGITMDFQKARAAAEDEQFDEQAGRQQAQWEDEFGLKERGQDWYELMSLLNELNNMGG